MEMFQRQNDVPRKCDAKDFQLMHQFVTFLGIKFNNSTGSCRWVFLVFDLVTNLADLFQNKYFKSLF